MEHLSAERLTNQLHDLAEVTERLVQATADNMGDKVEHARAQAERSLHVARKRLREVERGVMGRARTAGRETDRYVHENAWSVMAIAVGVAFGVGYLVGRRR